MSGILLFSDKQNVTRELLGKARQVADEKGLSVAAVYLGESIPENIAELGAWGADTVFTVESPLLAGLNPETFTDALAGVIAQVKPDLLLVGATKPGLEISARVAARLGIGCASFCVDFDLDADNFVTAQCMIYSGVGMNTYKIKTQPAMVTVSPAVFTAARDGWCGCGNGRRCHHKSTGHDRRCVQRESGRRRALGRCTDDRRCGSGHERKS